ncbi:hypothetical protein JHW38_00210 [Lysobacter enzymogenes]|nr:hypothetical protein JHW38_00210 [Lysobacter enzymogenes]
MPVFVDDLNDAIRATVNALGGMKSIGSELKPEKSAMDAGRWMADCLNPEKRDRLTPDQLSFIRRKARAAGVHILAAYEMHEAGYQPPVAIEPEDERAKLQRQFIEQSKRMEQLFAQLQRM